MLEKLKKLPGLLAALIPQAIKDRAKAAAKAAAKQAAILGIRHGGKKLRPKLAEIAANGVPLQADKVVDTLQKGAAAVIRFLGFLIPDDIEAKIQGFITLEVDRHQASLHNAIATGAPDQALKVFDLLEAGVIARIEAL